MGLSSLCHTANTHQLSILHMVIYFFPGGSEVKVSACNAGDPGLIPESGRSPGEGNGSPFQYSCLENPMDGGAWWATVHRVAKSRTRLSDFAITICFNANLYLSHPLLPLGGGSSYYWVRMEVYALHLVFTNLPLVGWGRKVLLPLGTCHRGWD